MSALEPYGTIYHFFDKVNQRGGVSALCFRRPRAMSLQRRGKLQIRHSWTLRKDAVTCPKCRRLLQEACQ
jgi:hypothetical protein